MARQQPYLASTLTRAEVEQSVALTVLDFGTNRCGHCQAAQPLVDAALQTSPQIVHHKIEDGKGRSLGRLFRVTLWPTLIFLRDGQEVARVVRPANAEVIAQALQQMKP